MHDKNATDLTIRLRVVYKKEYLDLISNKKLIELKPARDAHDAI